MTTAQEITFPGENRTLQGYVAYPDGEGPFPGVVIIHEIFGLTENIKDITRRFASVGYAALAVDLFTSGNRAVCMFRFMGQMIFQSLENDSIRQLKRTLSYLGEQPQVDSERIGAVGYCMGGSFAIAWASTDNRLKAVAPYYAQNPRPLAAVERSCPVVGSYPGKDFTTNAARKLDVALDTYKIEHDIKIYPESKHSFFNDKGGNYDPAASQDSWERVLSFFQSHLTKA